MKQLVYLLVLLFSIGVIGCRSTKKLNTAIAKKDSVVTTVLADAHADSMNYIRDVFSKLEKNRIDYKTFSAKMKVEYWDKDGKGPELMVFVRMQKDSLIWLSVNATVFSYEAFRILITPDSVKLINKKDKVVQFRSVKYLEEMAKIPFDFKNVQEMIIGNPLFLDSNIVSYKKGPNSISLLSIGELFKNLLTMGNENYLLQHIKLDDVDVIRNRTCDMTFSNYDGSAGIPFSTFRKISFTEKSKIDVQMEFKQFSFNESLAYPFSIPKNYSIQ
ncbi:DUF4292 domain-containing protein [Flavihumibacter stibioxidans]|uniref:DUF4292 domain-containing protein n=1 Tax=Flavihumibacter stibioxidans TaxID=1834163 RepID=A0ABR7M6C1_9BACT|nr:DUF4292 domain-containing protein [Flavihumibacter stibioxidans]MBC6490572.1 hypothetical protein [Flavihumibacter stibioxidans]